MGTNCSSAKEINTSSPQNVSSMNDTIKFNQVESNEGQKNDSFNQILENINEYQIENSKQFSDENNSIYMNNNNDNSNLNNNSDNIDQRVKNDIENSYNIADDIRSSFASNSLIEHGAVLNDNNSFFNNDELLYATDKLIEIHDEFQKDKQVMDFKSKMENLKSNKKKKDDNINNDDNFLKTKKLTLIGESKDDDISNTRIKMSTILDMNSNLLDKKSEKKRQSVFTDMNSLKNYFNRYTFKKNLTMKKKKSPNNDEIKSISLVPMKKSVTLNNKNNHIELNSKKKDLNNGINKNNNHLNNKDEDDSNEGNINHNNKEVKNNINNKLEKEQSSNLLKFKNENNGLGGIKSNSSKNIISINPDIDTINDENIKRREKKLLSCKPEYKEGIILYLNQKNLLNPNIIEENKDKNHIKSNKNVLHFEDENHDKKSKKSNRNLNFEEDNYDKKSKKSNRNVLHFEDENHDKKSKKSNKNVLHFEEDNYDKKSKKSNRNVIHFEEDNKDIPKKSKTNVLHFEQENKDIPKKSNTNLLNFEEKNKDIHKNLLNIEEKNQNIPKKSNKSLLNFEEKNQNIPKKSNQSLLKFIEKNKDIPKKSNKNLINFEEENKDKKLKKNNENILNIEEIFNNINKSLKNDKNLIKEDIENNLKKNNKNLIKINSEEDKQTKKSNENLIKINIDKKDETKKSNKNLIKINNNQENNEDKPKSKNINLLNQNIEEDNINKKPIKSILKKNSQEEIKEKKEENSNKNLIKMPLEEEKKSKKSNKSLKEIKLNNEDNPQIPKIKLNNEMIKFSSSSDDSLPKVNNEYEENNDSSSSSSSSSSSLFNDNFSDEKKHYNINNEKYDDLRKLNFEKDNNLKRKLSIIEEDKKEDLLNSLRKITEKSSYSESKKEDESKSLNEKNIIKLNSFKERNSIQNDKNKIINQDILENSEFTENYDTKSSNNKKKEEEFIASIPLQIKEIPKKKDLFTENRDSLTDLLKAIKEKEKVQYKNNTLMDLQRIKSAKAVSSYLKKKNEGDFQIINKNELKERISDNKIRNNNNEIKLIEIKDNFEEINPEFSDKQINNFENNKLEKSNNIEEENNSKKNNQSQNNKSNKKENEDEEESDKSDIIQIPNINNEILINKDFNENKNIQKQSSLIKKDEIIKEEIKDENNVNEKNDETVKELFSQSNEENKSEKDLVKENKQFNKKDNNDNETVKELSNEESKSEKELSHINNNSLKEKENETKKENNTNIKEDKINFDIFTPKTNNILLNTNENNNAPKLQNLINNIPKIESSTRNLDKNATIKKELNSEIMKIKINFTEDSENKNKKNSQNNETSNFKKNSLQREETYNFSNNKLIKPDIKEFRKSLTMSNKDENNLLIGQNSSLEGEEKNKNNKNQNNNKTNSKNKKIIDDFVKKKVELDYNDLVNEKYKRKFSHLIDSNVYNIDIHPDIKSIPNLNINNINNNNKINYNPLKTDGSVLLTAYQSNLPNYTIIKNTEFTYLNSPKKNDSVNEINNEALSVIQPLSAFHNNKLYQNLNDKISVNSERKLIFNQTITNFQRNQEFTIINTPIKQKRIYQIKYKFYDWEKNKQRIKNATNNKTYIDLENEKNEKTKRQFFFGLILYSELKKVIDITDKIIYSDKFCTLTNYEFNVYKNLSEFITLQKPYITIQRINIKNASRINISNKNENKGEPLIYFGIKYHNIVNNKTEVLFFASESEKLVVKWINILNREIEE